MKEQLVNEIVYMLNIKWGVPMDEAKNLLILQMNGYNVTKGETAVALRSEEQNEQFFRKFLVSKKVAGCTDRTIQFYGRTLEFIFRMIRKNVLDVTSDDIILYHATRMKDGANRVTCGNEQRVLSSFYNWMWKEELITKNPMNKVDRIKSQKRRDEKAMDDMQVARLRNACIDEFETALIEFLLSTGCRATEAARVKIADIDLDNKKVLVFGKGDKYRTVYLSAAAVLAVKYYSAERHDESPYLFPKSVIASEIDDPELRRRRISLLRRGGWWRYPEFVSMAQGDNTKINNHVKKIAKRAGLTGVHAHLLRKTFATNALRAGMPLLNVSRLLGHENIATTQIYLTYNEKDISNSHELYVR